ncbi:UNVERIFIED_CONTAM: hypothetical protein FKN15_070001, partial [Acipenser sinensis]
GKRVVGEDGSEGFSDLFQENAMLQKESDTLRMRVKAMQETIDALNNRITQLLSNEICQVLAKAAGLTPIGTPGSPAVSMETQASDVIRRAKQDIEKLKKKEKKQRRKSPEKEGFKKRAKLQHENGEVESDEAEEGLTLTHVVVRSPEKEGFKKKAKLQHENGEVESDEAEEKEEQEESGCEEEEEDEGEGREEEEYESEESLQDSDSDSEEKDNYQADLAELTCEIEIKQKLIDELENSQKRLHTLKLQYEQKLIMLQNKIRDTQLERDRVLHNLMSMENYTEEKASKIKSDYEKRLKEMNRDLQKLQAAQKEHARLLKNQTRYERELKKLQGEVAEMKKAKVALMKQMKEEQQRRRLIEAKRNREIAQLKKEQRRQEVSALRRLTKPMSDRVAGRVSRRLNTLDSGAELSASTTSSEPESARSVSNIVRQWNKKINGYVGEPEPAVNGAVNGARTPRKKFQRKGVGGSFAKVARQKWQALERRIMDIVMQRMTITNMEADMDRLIKKREELAVQQEALLRKREKFLNDPLEDEKPLQEMNEEIEVLNANIDYINDSLSDCQATIMQIEETKDELDSVDTSVVISSCSLAEARHLLDHFLKASIEKGLQVAQKETQIRLLEGRLRQTDMTGSAQNHMILDALREKAECIPELQALIHNVQQENGYASTDEEVSEFSQASEGSFSQSFTLKVSASQDDFKLKNEPKLSVQMKAVSAEYLGPSLDVSSRNMAKSLASLSEIRENGVVFSSRDSYSRDKVSRTISLPTRGNTLGVINPVGGIKGARTAPLQCVSVAEGHSKPVLCLDATDELLFTGSKGELFQRLSPLEGQQIPNAHKDWVSALAYVPGRPMLLSGCRGGMLKVWNVDNFTPIGEIKGHDSPINAICTNSKQIFTASSDLSVKIWRARIGKVS